MCLPLPPSARDFQIYQCLLLDGASTRQVAADFSLSQTRIRQIAQHVSHWLAHSLPPSCEATDASYLRLAQHIAADRLQLLYGEAMQGWRATHQSKYAGIILRVTSAMGKMPVTSGALDALLADALEGPLPDDSWEGEAPAEPLPTRPQSTFCDSKPTTSLSPPLRDCSPAPIPQPPVAQPATPAPSITSSRPIASNSVPRTMSAARREFLTPAHTHQGEASAEPSLSVTELKITPQALNFSAQKPLSRRDRRRLRRLAHSTS